MSYAPISLSGVPKLRFRVASGGAGGTIEARLDSPTGPLAGSVAVPVTGGWQQWQFVDMDIAESAQQGSHELFLVFTNANPSATGLFNVNFFDAAGKGVSVNSRPQVGAQGTPTQGTAPLTVDFTGSASDYDGDELTYQWDFGVPGDGDTATTLDAEYTYTEPGSYTARLSATDPSGATGYSTVPIRVLNACGVQQSDEFDGTSLDGKWDVIRDSGDWRVENGGLQLPINSGSLYGIGGNAEDIIVQEAPDGAFEVTAKVTAEVAENYHQAGLRLYSDDENWASVHLISAGGNRDVEFIYEAQGNPRNEGADKLGGVPAGFPTTYYVRLTSDGTDLRASYSADGETFSPVGRPAPMSTFTAPKIGPAAVSGGATTSPTATFDWIRFEPDGTSGATDPSDEFTGPGLDECRWNAIVREDPTKYQVADGQLTITTTEGDIYQTPNAAGATNFVLQSGANLPADYTAETKLSTTFTDGYAQAGLLAYGDDDNYVKLDVISDTGQGRINRVELRSELGGAIQDPQPQLDLPANVTSYRLRLTKQGTSYVGEVAVDGGEWQPVGTVAHPTADLDLGVYALGVQQPGRTASFDYFKLTPAAAENRPPVADDDTATTSAGRAVNINVLAGDTDPDGDTLTVESVTTPGDGTATINANGTVRYTPEAGFVGTDTFDYTVADGNGGSDTGTVTVTVTEACELETPDDTFEGSSLDTCRWNAIVADDATKRRVADGRLVLTTTPGEIYQGGTGKSNLVMQSADHAGEDWVIETHADVTKLDGGYSQAGLMAYGDDANYVKIVVISDDGRSAPNRVELRSEVNNVIVGANPQPELPIPTGTDLTDMRLRLTKTGTTYEGEASFDGGATWVDLPRAVDNAMTAPRFGIFAAGVLQEGDEVSFDTFLVDGEDPVDPVNAAPKAVDDSATTTQGTAVDIDVLANDTDADEGDELSVESVTKPAHGTAVVAANGTVTYTPDAGHTGTDAFDYVVTDGTDTDTGTVTVTTTRKADDPVPDTTITGAPRDGTRAKTATIRFTATGPGATGATFQCSLDGAAWQTCNSPQTYRGLADGEHEVRVRAVSSGGADATPATASWTVDRTGPRVRKVTPTGTTRDRTPKVSAIVTDRLSSVRAGDLKLYVGGERVRGVRYDAREDRMTWTPKRALASGRYAVRLVAEDTLGNRTVETWRFTIRR